MNELVSEFNGGLKPQIRCEVDVHASTVRGQHIAKVISIYSYPYTVTLQWLDMVKDNFQPLHTI